MNLMDFIDFDKEFYSQIKRLLTNPCENYEVKVWEDGKIIYDSTKDKKSFKPNNNAPKNIKGDYDLSIHGNKIVLVDNKDGTTVEAKCHPDDNFDISTGISEAFKKLNEKRDSEKKIEVGDKVEVIDNRLSYSTYVDWCYKNLRFEKVRNYRYGAPVLNHERGTVIAIAPHLNNGKNIVAIESQLGYIYLIEEAGLKKVGK